MGDIVQLIKQGRFEGRNYGAQFVKLAFQCMASFRTTDFQGGCNGARIRMSPEKDFPENEGLGGIFQSLKPVYENHSSITWADLIVVAGSTALAEAGVPVEFC